MSFLRPGEDKADDADSAALIQTAETLPLRFRLLLPLPRQHPAVGARLGEDVYGVVGVDLKNAGRAPLTVLGIVVQQSVPPTS